MEITRAQGVEELQGLYQLGAWSGPGCAISRCVQGQPEQGVSCCPLSQHCVSGFAGASEPRFLGIIFSSIFVIAGIIPTLSFEPTARQGCVAQLRETPVPYSAQHQVLVQAVIARNTLIPNASTPRTNMLYW